MNFTHGVMYSANIKKIDISSSRKQQFMAKVLQILGYFHLFWLCLIFTTVKI